MLVVRNSRFDRFKVWCVRLALTLRRIVTARADYRRCLKAETEAFYDMHYGRGSRFRWENASYMTRRAKFAYHRTLPKWLRPANTPTQADELDQLFEQVKAK